MIVIGLIMAVTAGLMQPGHIVLYGRVINQFILYNTAISLNNVYGNDSLTSLANQYATTVNSSCSISLILQGPLSSLTGETVKLLCSSSNDGVFSKVLEYACDPKSQLLSRVYWFSIYYVCIGVFAFLATFLANIFINISAYRQTMRIRHAVYHSILHQEIGWFDVYGGMKLSTQLAE